MRKRDRDIIKALEQFRCLSRDQVATLYFGHTKNAVNNANVTLKRLRDRGYIDANVERQPFVYFPKPATIKKTGNKVDHFLKMADVYTELAKHAKPRRFDIEPRYEAEIRPDVFTIWKGAPFFIEVQNSVYSANVMRKKLDRYQAFYNSDEWHNFDWQPQGKEPIFPYVLIVSDTKYKAEGTDFRVFQARSVEDFVKSIGA
ncbi:replication-relaxation family protein [Halalkalibacter urbisdiaboli]|uniref:replication-relaxation family protein n=1 Tax=Halalkalibacter urbisdiaboli TaxID=1960589 RepID=UPI000B443093|nr:replication-relaxation family protein [Halalkalibacter urbisdiaboli]